MNQVGKYYQTIVISRIAVFHKCTGCAAPKKNRLVEAVLLRKVSFTHQSSGRGCAPPGAAPAGRRAGAPAAAGRAGSCAPSSAPAPPGCPPGPASAAASALHQGYFSFLFYYQKVHTCFHGIVIYGVKSLAFQK